MSLFQLPHPSRSESKTGAQTDSLSRKRSAAAGRSTGTAGMEGRIERRNASARVVCVCATVWCVVCEASQEACCLWVPPATILHASSTMAGAGGDNTESAH
jgi:hypothetical protein